MGAPVKSNLVPLRKPVEADATLSDEALALACGSGDPVAVAELFNRFRTPVARYLHRLLRDSHDVEDCVQATFLELARGQARFEGRSAVSTWLFGVATNVARHHMRSAGRRAKLNGALSLVSEEVEPVSVDRTVDARRRLGRLDLALQRLTPERREAFVLCELEGLSAKEAASALGASETAIWKRVSDARRALRAALKEARR